MRIALFPDEYLPEGTRVHAKMFNELAVELQSQGHDVVVITPGKSNQERDLVIDYVNNVEVWRFRSGTLRGVGMVKRAINESLLSFRAWVAIRKKVQENPFELCINYSPTIFFGPLMHWMRKTHNSRIYLILRDMFPQWAIDEGIIRKGSIVARYFQCFERLNYKASHQIGLMSDANVTYFSSIHPQFKNLEVLRNWSNMKCHGMPCSLIDIRKQTATEDKVLFFYGGNIGHAQDMANLLRLVRNMKDVPSAHFLFVGQGDEFDLVLEKKEEWRLDNLSVMGAVSQEVYADILTQVDVGLFSLARSHKAHNFPGKLLGYKANRVPILGSLNPDNDLSMYINDNQCGFAYINGEDELLTEAARKLTEDANLREQLGENGRKTLEHYFSVSSAAKVVLGEYVN